MSSGKCLLVLLLGVVLFTTLCLANVPNGKPPHNHKPPRHLNELPPREDMPPFDLHGELPHRGDKVPPEHKPFNLHDKPPHKGGKPPPEHDDPPMSKGEGEKPPPERKPFNPRDKPPPKGEKPPPKREGGRKLLVAEAEAKPFFQKGHDHKPFPPRHHPGHPPEVTVEAAKKPPHKKPPTTTTH